MFWTLWTEKQHICGCFVNWRCSSSTLEDPDRSWSAMVIICPSQFPKYTDVKYVYVYICIYVCVCTYTCVCVYIYMYMYVHITYTGHPIHTWWYNPAKTHRPRPMDTMLLSGRFLMISLGTKTSKPQMWDCHRRGCRVCGMAVPRKKRVGNQWLE